MFRTAAILGVATLLCAPPAGAQPSKPRFYVASSTAIDAGSRGNIFSGPMPTAGGLFGVRLTDGLSLELELDRGFHDTARTAEAVWTTLAQPGASREEIERLGIRARFDRTQWAGPGASLHILWRTHEPVRVNAGLLAGVSTRRYNSRVVRTPVSVPPEWSLPADHPYLRVDNSLRRMNGTGPTVGVVILVRLTDALMVAPDLRLTAGMITNDRYVAVRAGTRLMWSF